MKQNIPDHLHYTQSHEWVRFEDEHSYTVGITHHAQDLLGDIVYVELPTLGTTFKKGQDFAVVESVKAAADVYCPIAGTITAVNDQLAAHPELLNKAPYIEGWLCRIQSEKPLTQDDLMSAVDYLKKIQEAETAS